LLPILPGDFKDWRFGGFGGQLLAKEADPMKNSNEESQNSK
jgi:hypothetical protein